MMLLVPTLGVPSELMLQDTLKSAVEAVRWFVLALAVWLGLNTLTRDNLPTLAWGIHGGALVASV